MPAAARTLTDKSKGIYGMVGRGLEALLGPQVGAASDSAGGAPQPHAVKLSQLQPGRYQPRTRMDEGSLFELAESIKVQGIMQPILVRPVGDGKHEIIAGERRWRAAQLAERSVLLSRMQCGQGRQADRRADQLVRGPTTNQWVTGWGQNL